MKKFKLSARQIGKTSKAAEEIAVRCGLNTETVMDLLSSGWTYTERLDQPRQWTDPSLMLEDHPIGLPDRLSGDSIQSILHETTTG